MMEVEMYRQIEACRICNSKELVEVLDLGSQALTGVFPSSRTQQVTSGPLKLVKCFGKEGCGLLQLQHSYDLGELYGDNYGYRSGLNASMVAHLREKVRKILERVTLPPEALVIDIGSNDSTTLQAYGAVGCTLVGIDPTGKKFHQYYPPHIRLIPDFFSAAAVRQNLGERKASVVTSFSMFYDLEEPLKFAREVHDVLADEGIWVFEQSYMPTMLERNSYDTVCHEHLEYYALKQIKWLTDRAGLKIIDVEFNDVN
ncbi:MAG: C-methyltransferase, partial [Gammaproteobacteria bacterium]|nr:C-methyltransferase [Gammaproteobacteria bacterium]